MTNNQRNDDVEIEHSDEHSDNFAAYYMAEDDVGNAKEPVYNEELGLAIEKLKDGFELKNLWDVVNG
jgi:Bardet-Biedl syndrome 5 protein